MRIRNDALQVLRVPGIVHRSHHRTHIECSHGLLLPSSSHYRWPSLSVHGLPTPPMSGGAVPYEQRTCLHSWYASVRPIPSWAGSESCGQPSEPRADLGSVRLHLAEHDMAVR